MDILRFIPGYTEHIYDAGKEPLFVLLVSFIIAFTMTRGYTRLARKRGWGSGNVGGVHLHHVVPGIILVLLGGLVSFTRYADSGSSWTSSRSSSTSRTCTGAGTAAPRSTRPSSA